jgi:muramoyltetrapeptide carboxypeptidase
VTGFSDVTALHLAIARQAQVITFHSPMPMRDLWQQDKPAFHFAATSFYRAIVANQYVPGGGGYVVRVPDGNRPVGMRAGRARGRLLGGNLTLICSTLGTPYAIQPEGGILFVEETNEPPYRIDRCLSQLKSAGILQSPAGILIGRVAPKESADQVQVDNILRDTFGDLRVPVVMCFPVGHTADNVTLPHGGVVEIDGAEGAVRLLEDPVLLH